MWWLYITSRKAFGGLPCSGTSTTAHRHLSANASMLCDSVLMSAGHYTGTCNVMLCMACQYAWGSIDQDCTIAWSAGQQAEYMPVHIVRDNAMPAI